MMMAPGLSSSRIPMNVRLFLALTVSLAVSPLIMDRFAQGVGALPPATLFGLIGTELLTGIVIGLLGRVYFFALQTMSNAAAMAIGFGNIPGAPFDDSEPLPAITTMIMMAATAMLFMMDLHLELIKGVVASYDQLPSGQWFGPRMSLMRIVDQSTAAFVLALRISAPFIVYSIVVNLAVGLTNKLTPQIPIFFLATPFVMMGGLFMVYFLISDYLTLFLEEFASWSVHG